MPIKKSNFHYDNNYVEIKTTTRKMFVLENSVNQLNMLTRHNNLKIIKLVSFTINYVF